MNRYVRPRNQYMTPSRTDLFMNLPTRGRVYTCECPTVSDRIYNIIPRLISSLSKVLNSKDRFPQKLLNLNIKCAMPGLKKKENIILSESIRR